MSEFNWIDANQRFMPQYSKLEPPVDTLISQIVGYKVYSSDPRILKVVMKFKRAKQTDEDTPDNLFQNPAFIMAIKKEFNQSL